MNTEALFLFLILLLGLVLCSFLGGNCGSEGFTSDNISKITSKQIIPQPQHSGASTGSSNTFDNYNHYTGNSTQLTSGTTFYGDKGTTAVVVNNSDGTQSLQITLPGTSNPLSFTKSNTETNTKESYTNYNGRHGSITKFNGPNGATATIITTNNGQHAIKVETSNGVYYYKTSGSLTNTTDTSTQYYGSTGYPLQQSQYTLALEGNNQYYRPNSNANSVEQHYSDNVRSDTETYGVNTNNTNNTGYYDTLPQGIPRNQIQPGKEDLYILKSEIVPPVCPACPVSTAVYSRQEPCPSCPPCARCPEPSFTCKKVPNYNAINNEYLPSPILNDFSQFGM
jgi:hypothetical protein